MDHDHDAQLARNGVCFTCTRAEVAAEVEARELPLPAQLDSLRSVPDQGDLLGGPSTGRQLGLVWEVMRDGAWHTLADIAQRTNMPEASISARLRDLRKPDHGEWTVSRRAAGGGRFAYRVAAQAAAERGRRAS